MNRVKVKKVFDDEDCLGIFALNHFHPEGEEVPIMYLHEQKCWALSGKTCTDRPDNIQQGKAMVVNSELDTDTMHTMKMNAIELGSKTRIDWEKISKMMKEHITFNLL